ncbi:PE domain-containing protein [Mycobacteroides chelonae]|uniref:PE domain-containing protein n=1 Tax=Mycobacteroides chelonae TaxID=1774 RepID=UPI000992E9D9|nr:PE domain-containing protein [Mycobacteroides chelonae]
MVLVHAEFEGMGAAATGVGALAGTRAGGAAGALPVLAAIVPPGLDEVSALNKALILRWAAQLAASMGMSEIFQELYAASITTAAITYGAADSATGLMIDAVGAL